MGRKRKFGVGVVVGLVILGALTSEDPETPPASDSIQVEAQNTATQTALPTRVELQETPTVKASATIEPSAKAIATATDTADTPTITPTSQMGTPEYPITPERDTYYTSTGANIRSCPRLSCASVGQLQAGNAVNVIGITQGEAIAGNSQWLQTDCNGETAYMHSSVLAKNTVAPSGPPPAVQQPAPDSSSGASGGQSGSQYTGPAVGPIEFTCPRNCDEARAMGLTAQQAAQCSHLDRDGDGVACYGD